MADKLISFVIPCYCSQDSIGDVTKEIINTVKTRDGYDYEIILVNDYSRDNTLKVINELANNNPKIVAIGLAKNFGQASAIMAGLQYTKGEYVICLDDDGQMPIESIYNLIDSIDEGSDIAFGRYDSQKQKWYRNIGSSINLLMTELLLGKPKDVVMSSFWCARKYIIDEMLKYNGPYPYIGGLMCRVTHNMSSVPVIHRERTTGTSGYTFFKLLGLWMNGFTAFSVKPLRFATFFGITSAFVGFILSIVMVVRKILNPDIILGYSSLMTVILIIGGMIMLLLGMLGEYVGRIYISINSAPQFVIKDVNDNRDDNKGDK